MFEIISATGNIIPQKVMEFSGGERHVEVATRDRLAELNIDVGDHFTIRVQEMNNSNDLIDLILACSSLKEEFDLPLYVELPYLPYARQDRVCAPGQPNSLMMIRSLISFAKINKLVCWDLHSQASVTMLWAINMTPDRIMRAIVDAKPDGFLSQTLRNDSQDLVIVAPDHGAMERASRVAEEFGIPDVQVCVKVRDPATGQIQRLALENDVDLKGKRALIIDDICDGGRTFCESAKALLAAGAEEVMLWVTHGIFSKGLGPLKEAGITKVMTTSSRGDARDDLDSDLMIYKPKYNFITQKMEVVQ